MTSIMCWLRRLLADISPKAQRMPSEILDLPQPFGPTTAVIPGSNSTRVLSAKDLNPTISKRFNRTGDRVSIPQKHCNLTHYLWGLWITNQQGVEGMG